MRMTIAALLFGLLASVRTVAYADPILTVLGGFGFPTSHISLVGGGSDSAGDPGPAWGAQILFPVAPNFLLGGEFLRSDPNSRHSSSIFQTAPAVVDYQSHSNMYSLCARINFPSSNRLIPFLSLGTGLYRTSLNGGATPKSGFIWSDSGTSEKRTVVDESDSGSTLNLSLGLDFLVQNRLKFGIESRYEYLSNSTFDASLGSARSKVTLNSSFFAMLARLSFGG